MISINSNLHDNIMKILNNTEPAYFSIECNIFSKVNEQVKVTPLYVNHLSIRESFSEEYTNVVQANICIPPKDLVLLINNEKDLYMTLKLRRVNEKDETISEKIPTKLLTYRCIIVKANELLKTLNPNQIYASEKDKNKPVTPGQNQMLFNIDVQLIDEFIYDIKKKQFSGILNNCTVKQAVYYIANTLGIKNLEVVEPNNTVVYPTIIFDPMHDLSSAMELLQDKYGVYSKGLGYYFQENKLYVYPELEINLNSPTVINIYTAPSSNYIGNTINHYLDPEGNLHILNNTTIGAVNPSTVNSENKGNNFISLRTDTSLDINRDINTKQFKSNNVMVIKNNDVKNISDKNINTKFVGNTSNMFKLASDVTKGNLATLISYWKTSIPYTIKPNIKVVYHYQDFDSYKTTTGIFEYIDYTISLAKKGSVYIYISNSRYVVKLNPIEEHNSVENLSSL